MTAYTAPLSGRAGACKELLEYVKEDNPHWQLDFNDAVAIMIYSDHGYAKWLVTPIHTADRDMVYAAIIDDTDNCYVRLVEIAPSMEHEDAWYTDKPEFSVLSIDFPYDDLEKRRKS